MKIDPYKHKERYQKWRKEVNKTGIPELSKYNSDLIHPLFVVSENKLKVFSENNSPKPEKDDLLISLIFENN